MQGVAEYLVLRAGYRKEEATWVNEGDITLLLWSKYYGVNYGVNEGFNLTLLSHRYFHAPQPSCCCIVNSVSSLTSGIGQSLKLGVNRGCHFTVHFQTDAFKFLFDHRGRKSECGSGSLYGSDVFNPVYLPVDLFRVYDKLGDGCEVEFLIRMCSQLKWSPLVYEKSSANVLTPKHKSYEETCSVWLTKRRCY